MLKYAFVLLSAAMCWVPVWGGAHAEGPVGGSAGPGDPSLLVTYPDPSTANVSEPTPKVSEPVKPDAPAAPKDQPEPLRKDG